MDTWAWKRLCPSLSRHVCVNAIYCPRRECSQTSSTHVRPHRRRNVAALWPPPWFTLERSTRARDGSSRWKLLGKRLPSDESVFFSLSTLFLLFGCISIVLLRNLRSCLCSTWTNLSLKALLIQFWKAFVRFSLLGNVLIMKNHRRGS